MAEKLYPSENAIHLKGVSFFKRHPFIPNWSIYQAVKLINMRNMNLPAVDCLDIEITYGELIETADHIAKAMVKLGVKENDIVAAAMPNYYQAVAVYLAANKIGAVTTFLNNYATAEELIGYLNQFTSPIFFNFDENEGYNKNILYNTSVKHIVTLDKKNLNIKFNNMSVVTIKDERLLSFSALKMIAGEDVNDVPHKYGLKQDSMILFTSGSTGNPKSVVLTNENILASGTFLKNSSNTKTKPGEKSLVCVPFCYPYGFITSTLTSLLCGREAILAPDLSSQNIDYYLQKQPNIVFGSPALLELVMRNASENRDLSSIHSFISGGDFLTPIQKEKGEEFFRKHHAEVAICNGSGNAETVAASTNALGVKPRPETVGKVLYGDDVIVVDPASLKELPYGEEGVLCISGRNVFKGYYKEPELTAEMMFTYKGKNYFKTGNRGILDIDGYFTLTGRESRYYIMSTLNKIYCDHVQSIIAAIDCVSACADVQKPDKDLLFTNKAFIILKDGWPKNDETKAHIFAECKKQQTMSNGEKSELKPYEIPSGIEFVDTLPRTQADKIDYRELETKAANN